MNGYLDKVMLPEQLIQAIVNRPRIAPLPPASDGLPRYVLVESHPFKAFGQWWDIDAGYVYDGASVPKSGWLLSYPPGHSAVLRAALHHDFFCDLRPVTISSLDAATLFHDELVEDGADPERARLMFTAVKSFGPQWK